MKSLTLCGVVWLVVALSAQAGAEDVYDLSIAGFGGFAIPQETRVTQSSPTRNENFTARNVQLDSGGSYGVKLTAWTTALREKNGFDLGIELDHTRFSADTRAQTVAASGVSNGVPVHSAFVNKNDVSARTIAVNALFRIPFGITDQLPHGRWYPYLGGGGGVEHATMRLSDGSDDSNSTLLVQGLAGLKIFIVRHLAMFAEYKYTYAAHTFVFDSTRSEIVREHHMTFGLAVHF